MLSPCILSSHEDCPLLGELVEELVEELLGPFALLGVGSVLLAPGLLLGVIDGAINGKTLLGELVGDPAGELLGAYALLGVGVALLGVVGITEDGVVDGEALLDVQALQ